MVATCLLRLDEPVLVISPHLDDAVLSCGELIARHPGCAVMTVFAGVPANPARRTLWDTVCGFSSAAQAIAQRRREDQAALSVLGARALWLDFSDRQYRPSWTIDDLAQALAAALRYEAMGTVCIPAGLFHSDHIAVHGALAMLQLQFCQCDWIMYEDALYRCRAGLVQRRLRDLAAGGVQAVPVPSLASEDGAKVMKRAALTCYRSQLQGLSLLPNGYADAFQPERYWRLSRPMARAGQADEKSAGRAG